MAAKPIGRYESHTEPEAIIPNRIVRNAALEATLASQLTRTVYADFVEKHLGS